MSENTTTPREIAARLSWGNDCLVIPRDLSLGRIARNTLSVSSAKSIESCPARWAAEKLFDTSALFDPSTIGNGGHDVLERLFQLPGEDRTEVKAGELLVGVADDYEQGADPRYLFLELADPSVRVRWTAAVWAGIATLWQIEDPSAVDVWATEFEVKDVSLSGVPFGGFIDRIDRVRAKTGTVSLRMVDYKTGRAISQEDKKFYGDAHGDQLRLYASAVEQMLRDLPADHPDHGLKVTEALDYYTKHGKSSKVALSAPYRRKTLAAHVEAWGEHAKITQSGRYPTKASALCTFCPLVRQCPGRSENVNWARVKPSALTLGEAPIMGPVSEYRPQPIIFGDGWDTMLRAPEIDMEDWFAADLADLAQRCEPAAWQAPALEAPPGSQFPVQQSAPPMLALPQMNPFLRIGEDVFTAELDPFSADFEESLRALAWPDQAPHGESPTGL